MPGAIELACFACHQEVEKASKAFHLSLGQQVWGHGLGRSFRDLPASAAAELGQAVTDLEDSLTDGAPTDHFGRLHSDDALHHARALVDAIRAAMFGSDGRGTAGVGSDLDLLPLSCDATPAGCGAAGRPLEVATLTAKGQVRVPKVRD